MGQSDPGQLQLVRLAGLVHDIGKVGLPPKLCDRKGRLRPAERKLLEEHCAAGAKMLARVPHMSQLADIVLYHHEYYDGSGYPAGLAGNRIPIESRLLAVADAYDAMTSSRPYRPAFSHREAVQRICEASGTQFDPAVVDAFMKQFGSEHGQALLLNTSSAPRVPAARPVACAVE